MVYNAQDKPGVNCGLVTIGFQSMPREHLENQTTNDVITRIIFAREIIRRFSWAHADFPHMGPNEQMTFFKDESGLDDVPEEGYPIEEQICQFHNPTRHYRLWRHGEKGADSDEHDSLHFPLKSTFQL